MNTPLEQLYRLQDRIRFVQSRQKERDTIPSELVEVDREYQEKVEAVARLKKRAAEADGERRRAMAELSEHRERLRKYQTQLRAVQNSREYGAVLNEIDGVEKLVRAAEEKIASLDAEIRSASKELAGREELLPLETEQHEEKLKDWRGAQKAINEELAGAQEEIKRQAYAEIAKARFAIEGTSNYPDATFTLRLSYGKVMGYEEDGKQIPPFTDFAGLYQRSAEHDNQPPFDLPQRWIERKAQLNLATKFNFVSDADIIGGNSGSPVVNKANEFVGIIFDGNIQSLVLDCIFSDKQARAVSVDSAAISEALRKVYDAGTLADELEGQKQAP